jgi:hypothetical protein
MTLLFKLFSHRIIIDLHPSKFTFSIREKDVNVSFVPFLYLEKNESKWLPVAIGEEIPSELRGNPNIYKIDVKELNDSSPSESIMSGADFFQVMFEYGLGKCFERYWFPQLRPVVFILGANRFGKQFQDPKGMLEKAVKLSGAKVVVFDNIEL